tara:strand:+ start:5861 stop:6472 length:612 start_codon:yes stop_codon:yes gene_type:complete
MTNLIVYDFDGTIYNGDSFVDFWKFIIKNNWLAIIFLPFQLVMAGLFFLKLISPQRLKESFLTFFALLAPIRQAAIIESFWTTHHHKINPWIYSHFLERNQQFFVCISASPEFLLAPIIQDLNFQMLIGSIFKVTDTKIVNQMVSKNCKGMEKIHRLNAVFKDGYTIDQFYSDHPDDAPLFKLANESYLVKNGKISPLPDNFL